MTDEFEEFQLSQNSKQDTNRYLNLFNHINNNKTFFRDRLNAIIKND